MIRHFHEQDARVTPATLRGIDAAVDALAGQGAVVADVTLSPLQDWMACGSLISITERCTAYEEWAQTRLGDFGERVRGRLMLGAFVTGTDYVQALRLRRELRAEIAMAATDCDILITAAAPGEAPRMDAVPAWDNFARPSFTIPFNVCGWPAMSVCAGFGDGGLPVAVQFVAKPFQEATLFRAAHAFEAATPHRARRPMPIAA